VNYQFADVDIIYEQSSSTGELIFEFLKAIHFPLDQKTATALYTCILTDTGSFRFSNTTSITHQIASELLNTGINTKEIYELVYEQNSRSKMALMGEALYRLNYECEGKVAWFVLTKEMFAKHQASCWDTEGFSELPRSIEGVEVSLMFTELNAGETKISLRSKGKIEINSIAEKFGGGGHSYAAGSRIQMSLSEAIPLVLEEVKSVIDGQS
jgi:phosphoesterase RecJ-like protein